MRLAASVVRGRRIYFYQCAMCHGEGGSGHGGVAVMPTSCRSSLPNFTKADTLVHTRNSVWPRETHGRHRLVLPVRSLPYRAWLIEHVSQRTRQERPYAGQCCSLNPLGPPSQKESCCRDRLFTQRAARSGDGVRQLRELRPRGQAPEAELSVTRGRPCPAPSVYAT